MAETSTPQKKSSLHSASHNAVGPKKSTLAFLRQFARCYTPQPTIDASLAGLIIN